MTRILALVLGASLIVPTTALAEQSAWADIKEALYADQFLLDGSPFISVSAPYRADDDARVVVGAEITLPDGDLLKTVRVVLDNNPAPVSAVFTLADPVPAFAFDATLRINGPTPLHVTAESTTGKVFMVEGFIKTSGLGACSAPPGTDPLAALETLGEMVIEFEDDDAQVASNGGLGLITPDQNDNRARVSVSHPSHSGMQMDQITLLFLPMRTVQTLDIESNASPYMSVEGSISLSENPELSFSVPKSTVELGVTMTDTDGAVTTATKHRLVQ